MIAVALLIWWNWWDITESREVQHLRTQCRAQWELAVSTVHQFEEKLEAAGRTGGHR